MNIFCSILKYRKNYHGGQKKNPDKGECMASVPISGPGSIVIANNMREARLNGMSRNMATPSTYY